MFIRAFLLVSVMVVAFGQDNPPVAPAAPPPKPVPKNLKVLKSTTGEEVSQIMRTFTTGLGVQCNFCHIQGNFASDENPKKDVARRMISMTHDVNALFPDSATEKKLRVSCYTCHRGEAEPKTVPPAVPAAQ